MYETVGVGVGVGVLVGVPMGVLVAHWEYDACTADETVT
jgi:hypothetical protein